MALIERVDQQPQIDLKSVQNWFEFFELAEQLSRGGWAFRGQADANWPITSTLSRYLQQYVDTQYWVERERRSISVFRRKAHHFLSDVSALEDGLRCLALMQHHGAPTRLIDFSKSPYVAAYFALERATGDAAVYALNTPWLWCKEGPSGFANLDRSAIDPRLGQNLNQYFFSNQYPLVWPGEPRTMDSRIVSQSGTFVVPGVLDQSVNELLCGYDSQEALLIKIVLPYSMRHEAIEGLYRMNITQATLFPDLDGLAKSIAGELEVEWAGKRG